MNVDIIFANDENSFIRQIEAVQQQAQSLYQSAKENPQPQLLHESLEQLQNTLEELYVAEEELRQQNEQLIEARQAVEMERQRYQELFEFAPDSYFVTDSYGLIREANRAAALMLNIEQKYLIGKPLVSFIPEEHRPYFRSMLNQLHTVSRIQEWEVLLSRRGNELLEAAVTVETVRDTQGQIIALRWMIRDITTRKQAEEKLRQIQLQNLELIEIDQLKSQFMATISHELRTPMNLILGFSEVLLRRFRHNFDSQYLNIIERIFHNGKQLSKLIEEILDLSQLKAESFELKIEVLDLAQLVNVTVEELRPLAQQKKLNLQVCLAKPSISVVNDSLRLRQIISNLLSNAIKFTDRGSIYLEVWELPNERIAIAVRDTGIGIDSASQAVIFQEFRQINQTLTRRQGGAGLGLSISKALIQLMQGTICVESEIGKGSTFTIELPRIVSLG